MHSGKKGLLNWERANWEEIPPFFLVGLKEGGSGKSEYVAKGSLTEKEKKLNFSGR